MLRQKNPVDPKVMSGVFVALLALESSRFLQKLHINPAIKNLLCTQTVESFPVRPSCPKYPFSVIVTLISNFDQKASDFPVKPVSVKTDEITNFHLSTRQQTKVGNRREPSSVISW